jgi:hypothetical protein
MNSILTTTLTAVALALSLSALSAGLALADCGQPHGGIQNMEEGSYDWHRDRNGRLGNLPGLEPKFGAFMGGVRIVMAVDAAGKAKPAVGKKRNCDKLKDQIKVGERRLDQMKSRLDRMLDDFSEKNRNSTKADISHTADAIAKLDDAIKARENTLKRLRKALKKCE